MIDELIYTSAPRGLRPGSSGFCTVAASAALGPAWMERLESISTYRTPLVAGRSPPTYAHARLTVAGQTRSVLSCLCDAGVDHTGRGNTLAHHLVLSDDARPAAGPAWSMRQRGVLRHVWGDAPPQTLPARATLPTTTTLDAFGAAKTWQAVAGDAGWAGVLADHAARDPQTVVYLICPPGIDVLALIDEALRLLPESRRWLVTFNTCLNEATPGIDCAWRCVTAGAPAAAAARGHVLDLLSLDAAALCESPLVHAARSGARVAAQAETPVRSARTSMSPIRPVTAIGLAGVSEEKCASENARAVVGNSGERGIGFWLLVIGLPGTLLCVGMIVLLMWSARAAR